MNKEQRKLDKRGDLALNLIFTMVIALAAITLLFAMFGQNFSGIAKNIYCNTFFSFAKNIPGSDVKSTECINYIKLEEYMINPVNQTDSVRGNSAIFCNINESLMANVIACWQRADFGKSSKDFLCKQVIVSQGCPIDSIDMDEVAATQILKDKDLCEVLSNNDVQLASGEICGDSDMLKWDLKTIGKQRSALIEYRNNIMIVS